MAEDGDYIYILLADDDGDDRLFFAEAIAELDQKIQLTTVKDGDELMKYLSNTIILPHFIFVDLNMPFKNGLQCLEEIRANPAYNDVCVILYSTTARQGDIDKGYERGANLFINKPNSFTDLVAIMRRVLSFDLKDCHNMPKDKFFLKL